MSEWPKYQSHKTILAMQIHSIGKKTSEDTATVLFVGPNGMEPFVPNEPAMADKASVGDYAVIYSDGYKSVSPKKAFEEGYTRV